jgi:hypothetical protein
MSDHYDVNGVTVTPLGGGFYELKHASITAEGGIEKVRGKEAADKRAEEIAKADAPSADEGAHMQPQPPLAGTGGADGATEPTVDERVKAERDKSSALEAQLKEALAQRDELMKAAEKGADAVTTIRETEGEKVEGRVPLGIPTTFEGDLAPEHKKALKAAGLGWTKIILEENSDIPPTGLFVGHNGKGYMIQPGVPCEVPDFVLGVLKDAKMSAPVVDSKSLKVLGYRERMKYPYRLAD